MEQQTVTIKNFSRIAKIVQVSAMKVHFQIAERSLFYLNPDIHYRRMTYPPERGYVDFNKGIIYELKPGNPKGVQQGIRQLDKLLIKLILSPL
ncbi:MAG: hypothetical protein IKH64_09305 [Prevotella sp.]|nr:hypothetical protein [Prevotella sp.]